jgi:hypothetical protein
MNHRVEEALHHVSDEVRRDFHNAVEACTRPPESRIPALVAALAVGGLHMALPKELAVGYGPRWLLPAVVAVLLVPTVISLQLRSHLLNHVFGFLTLAVVTMAEVWSLYLLVMSLPSHALHHLTPGSLLISAASLWATNVLVFGLWYWRLDAGGPHARDQRITHTEGAFLFPQMTLSEELKEATGQEFWTPNFVDYLFLSFNHSTALSPTDTAILSRWAKILIMLQAGISLTTVAILAGRAVNIL